MDIKKLSLATLVFLFLFPMTFSVSINYDYEFYDKANPGVPFFFLVALDKGEDIQLKVEREEWGNFSLFLFDKRPEKSYITLDRELEDEIFDDVAAYDTYKEPYINFTADKEQVYYIELVLLRKGPDFFTLKSTEPLSRYYLPQVPGYQVELLLLSVILSIGVVLIILKRRITKL